VDKEGWPDDEYVTNVGWEVGGMWVSSKASLFPEMNQTCEPMQWHLISKAADHRIQNQTSEREKDLDSHALSRLYSNHESK